MENCLVTKLKAVVNNDNLTQLGKIKIPVLSTTGTEFAFNPWTETAGEATVTVVDSINGVIRIIDSVANNVDYFYVQIPNGGYLLYDNKYAFKEGFMSNIPSNGDRSRLPKIEEFVYSPLIKLSCAWCIGDIKYAANIDTLEEIIGTYFTGDIKDYIAERISRGYGTGSIQFEILTSNGVASTIKINGVTPYNANWTANKKHKTLHWENINKYFLTTTYPSVYIHGYSNEEITAMQETGGDLEGITEIIPV